MIDKKTKKAIIKAVGIKHISKIVEYAEGKEYKKSNGMNYTGPEFSMVLHGRRDVDEIENIILECAEYYIEEKEAQEKRKKELQKRVNQTA